MTGLEKQDMAERHNDERTILLEVTVKPVSYTLQATKIAIGLHALLPDGSDVRIADPADFALAAVNQALREVSAIGHRRKHAEFTPEEYEIYQHGYNNGYRAGLRREQQKAKS